MCSQVDAAPTGDGIAEALAGPLRPALSLLRPEIRRAASEPNSRLTPVSIRVLEALDAEVARRPGHLVGAAAAGGDPASGPRACGRRPAARRPALPRALRRALLL